MQADAELLLERAVAGARLSADEGAALFDAELTILGLGADAITRRLHGLTASYTNNRHIVYANACASQCAYCRPRLTPDSPDAVRMTPEQAAESARDAVSRGATEVVLQGGHDNLDYQYYLDLVRAVAAAAPRATIAGFSPSEVSHLSRLASRPLQVVLGDLKAAGLQVLVGGALEPLRNRGPEALAAMRLGEGFSVLEQAAQAGLAVLGVLRLGVGEELAERAAFLARLRHLQDATGAVTGLLLWAEGIDDESGEELSVDDGLMAHGVAGFDYLRTVSVARLLLDNVKQISASWHSQGAKIAEIALGMGANHWGGLYLDENRQVELAASVRGRLGVPDLERLSADARRSLMQVDSHFRPV